MRTPRGEIVTKVLLQNHIRFFAVKFNNQPAGSIYKIANVMVVQNWRHDLRDSKMGCKWFCDNTTMILKNASNKKTGFEKEPQHLWRHQWIALSSWHHWWTQTKTDIAAKHIFHSPSFRLLQRLSTAFGKRHYGSCHHAMLKRIKSWRRYTSLPKPFK